MSNNSFVTRFAPSPTGLLHLGHAYSALAAYEAAQNAGGRFLLRIEDIDETRCKPEFEKAILEDLAWLGLEWEEPARRQSDHYADYADALNKLREKGLVYRCFKTRKEIAAEIASAPHLSPSGPEGPIFTGQALPAKEERSLIEKGAPYAWRLSLKAAEEYLGSAYRTLQFEETGETPGCPSGFCTATPEIFGDVILARKDIRTSYHLASVWDDALQGVTHVIRGSDLYASTHLHRLLQALLDLPAPQYRHHKLLTDKTGKRFAKRDQSVTLKAMREAGDTPASIRRLVGL